MTEIEFRALAAQGYNRIPLLAECLADLDTPLSLYVKLIERSKRANSFLLESVVGGERFGRYSIIGLSSPTRIVVRGQPLGAAALGAIGLDARPLGGFVAGFVFDKSVGHDLNSVLLMHPSGTCNTTLQYPL